MKNMKVRTKLNLILVLVILLVAFGGTVSVKDMEDVKDKALETMEASSRQSYDDSIKEQVEVVTIRLGQTQRWNMPLPLGLFAYIKIKS